MAELVLVIRFLRLVSPLPPLMAGTFVVLGAAA